MGRRSCKVCQITAKIVFDGQHPERASWDGNLPGGSGKDGGCKDADDMPRIKEPQDECAELCADNPPCKYCELQYKCQLLFEFSIENAELMENCP